MPLDNNIEMCTIIIAKMNTNYRIFQKFEKELLKKDKLNIYRNFKIFDALYKEAIVFGALPLKNPIEGIETIIKIAKVVNSVPKSS